jgi:hypothetical protein
VPSGPSSCASVWLQELYHEPSHDCTLLKSRCRYINPPCASQPQSLAGLHLRLTAHSATAAYSNLCDGRSTPASGRLAVDANGLLLLSFPVGAHDGDFWSCARFKELRCRLPSESPQVTDCDPTAMARPFGAKADDDAGDDVVS